MALIGVYSLQGRTRVNRIVVEQLSVYYNPETLENFCNSIDNTLVTIYAATYTTLADINTNNGNIYTNPGLTNTAPSGFYGITDGGLGNNWYQWTGIWANSGSCQD